MKLAIEGPISKDLVNQMNVKRIMIHRNVPASTLTPILKGMDHIGSKHVTTR